MLVEVAHISLINEHYYDLRLQLALENVIDSLGLALAPGSMESHSRLWVLRPV
ncbi:hypothetical protein M378DRAFT_170235 [Amanita muscaria Koide BX008]|uniref:Uncharacterized protein n=1 Tax=Amanita muscaria (strain Koide BX008) TaxID=946122 RepID=A0A0C2WBM1_AMAMK|nr:hypothetical protein M378DRAFT_170235 [Amanita muscaria Koide BX008]